MLNESALTVPRSLSRADEYLRELISFAYGLRLRAKRELHPANRAEFLKRHTALTSEFNNRLARLGQHVRHLDNNALAAFQQNLTNDRAACVRIYERAVPGHAVLLALIESNRAYFLNDTDELKTGFRVTFTDNKNVTQTLAADEVQRRIILALVELQ